VQLVVAEDVWGHSFRVFGFPAENDAGVWASGRLLARQAMRWVQIEDVKRTGFRVEPGFSGAAVWDDELHGVVGMAVASERRPDVRAAYLIPTAVLVETWPFLGRQTISACPYRGLFAFREQDAAVFFGREELTGRLVEAVTANPLVTVVGPSGSGKSSLTFAGLLPRLRQREDWVIADLRPGRTTSPVTALADALLPLLEPSMSESQRLLELPTLAAVLDQGRLAEVAERILDRNGTRHVTLIVDQFEELFARTVADRSRFLELLLAVVDPPEHLAQGGIHLVLVLRADFLGPALSHPGLAAAIQGTDYLVGPMTTGQLRQVIEAPAAGRVTYEHGLVERILYDLGDEPGSLPLLEFTLTLLWEQQTAGTITHASYEAAGGVLGALTRYAEDVYLGLPEPRRADARQIFIQLVRPGEATEHTRRLARHSDLTEDRWTLAQALAASRLLVVGRDPVAADTVELVHEALIAGWDRLRSWIEADRTFRTWQERLREAKHAWEVSGRDDGALLRGAPLTEAERWIDERSQDIAEPERAFVAASRGLRAQEQRSARAARRSRRLALLVIPLLVAAVVAGLLAVRYEQSAGLRQRQAAASQLRANASQRQAESRQLAGAALAAADRQPSRSLLLALNAVRTADTVEARNSLLAAVQHDPRLTAYLPASGPADSVIFSSDGRRLLVASSQGSVTTWNVARRTPIGSPLVLSGTGRMIGTEISPKGDLVAAGWEDRVEIRRIRGGTLIRTLRPANGYPVEVAVFDAAERYIATGTISGGVDFWTSLVSQPSRHLVLPVGESTISVSDPTAMAWPSGTTPDKSTSGMGKATQPRLISSETS
jgi:Novel STAND NTPase 1